jgi:uncharacterized membrane protein YfcA
LIEAAALLAAGGLIGLLAGLLGIGGGVVAVPVLLEILAGRPDAAAVAIGTAHAAVLIAALPAVAAHRRAGGIDGRLLRAWLPPMLVGAVAGLALARIAPQAWLVGSFAAIAATLALRMLLGEGLVLAAAPPAPPLGWLPPALVGGLAAALGIGAGTLSGPTLALLSVPLAGAVGAGSVFNLAVALPAVAIFALAGQVALLPLLLLVAPSFVVAPWAARLSRRLDPVLLRRVFGLVLLAIAGRMAWRLLA